MKKTAIYFILFIQFFLSTNIFAEEKITDVLQKITNRMKQSNSISYNIDYSCKMLYSQSTEKISGKVEMIRDENEKNFGCVFWYKATDSLEKYFDGKTIYAINHKRHIITTQEAAGSNLELITQDLDGDLIRIPFVAPESINGLNSKDIKLKYKMINVKYPDEERISDAEMDLVYDVKNFNILRIFSKMVFHSQTQSNEWVFRKIVYGKVSRDELHKRFLKYFNKYKLEKYQLLQHQLQNK